MYKIMDGNEACSYVSYNFSELAGIYPITPSSPMPEFIDKWSSTGKLNYYGKPVKVVEMESETGAIALCHGALQNGILATTYTASQGLLLMIPNMYKIAGEMLPCVINVAARSLATHALSILGDHQDIYATRQTGFAFLASSSVQQVMDLTSVAYLSALKGKIPFVNFFDGFRTSHELQKIEVLDVEKVKPLIDKKALEEFRNKALSINKVTRGVNENDDIYFQVSEARNKYYDELPDVVNAYMEEINKITGRDYKPFNYYGDKNATKVIVAMGSGCETVKETVDYLNKKGEKVGLLEVHLYRPFSAKYFLNVLPKTVKEMAVLDRTKECGASEPLYLDVVNVIKENNLDIEVVGGRFGLSSKNTTPEDFLSVYNFLDSKNKFNGFTIGITDDVTHLSLPRATMEYDDKATTEMLIYGFGSDGMVSVSKDLIKIVGTNSDAYVQEYSEYDSKKSGGVTKCHLRFSENPIRSTYYVRNPKLVVCTKDTYLRKFRMLENIKEGGTFLLNTSKDLNALLKYMTEHDKKIIIDKKVKFYVIDANKVAFDAGLGNKINTVMATAIFKIGNLIDFDFAISEIKKSLETLFANKGREVIDKNINAIDGALTTLSEINITNTTKEEKEVSFEDKAVFDLILEREGNNIPVSRLMDHMDGTFEGGLAYKEDKDIADFLPCYDASKCITCNQCSFVCPHGVIRPFLLNEEEEKKAPESVKKDLQDAKIKEELLKFTIGTNYDQCTGCGLCASICPGKAGEKALTMVEKETAKTKEYVEKNDYLTKHVTEKIVMPINTVKGSQFVYPKFEFSGACAGCGETPYLKLLSQLFGDELVVSNATGCSSIYGGSIPGTSYKVPWANSLFEDNAEFGMGLEVADRIHKDNVRELISSNLDKLGEYKDLFNAYLEDPTYENSVEVYNALDKVKVPELASLKEFVKEKSFWIIGGDGWAYDIGYNGLDHVLSTNENVNILVLDTEVYSNTGGQSSKSSKIGQVAKFAASGKKVAKKDLARMALSYPHVYVGQISLGANMMHAIKTFMEAKNHNGPSIIIAYAPCINHGLKGGMVNSTSEEKKATEAGYFPIFRYNPETKEFSLDSKADFTKYKDFLDGENRYTSLAKVNPEHKDELYEQNEANAKSRYNFYESLDKE